MLPVTYAIISMAKTLTVNAFFIEINNQNKHETLQISSLLHHRRLLDNFCAVWS
jgi:DNA repair ATPase RecN